MTNSRNSIEMVRVLINTAFLIFLIARRRFPLECAAQISGFDIAKDLFLKAIQTSYLLIESE